MTTANQSSEAFQIPIEAAEVYESKFVPALFAQWAPVLCAAAHVLPGQRVLDVACGTGIVARSAAEIVGAANVVAVDLNEAMLAVARRIRPDIEWLRADVSSLPLKDASFDAVLCQMALMFFPDRVGAMREMGRVVTEQGRVAVLVPSGLDEQPAYGPFVDMAVRHAGPEARSLLGTYFECGDLDLLASCAGSAGLEVESSSTWPGTIRFPSIDALVTAEVESTPLATRISRQEYQLIREGARELLAEFTRPDGSLEAPFRCSLVTARRN